MIAEPTYEQMQALAIKLTQKLCKCVAAGDEDLSEEEAFIVTVVVELYDRLGTARNRRAATARPGRELQSLSRGGDEQRSLPRRARLPRRHTAVGLISGVQLS